MTQISPLTVHRLAVYLRALRDLRDRGVPRVSSDDLARLYDFSAPQFRKDLAQFGEFGIRGVGYDVSQAVERLTGLLGLHRSYSIAIVGMGGLGSALARSPGFNSDGFRVVAAIDSDPQKIGRRIDALVVQSPRDLRRVVRDAAVDAGVLTVPAEAAPEVAEQLVAAGVRALLNFTTAILPAYEGVRVQPVDLRLELDELAFHLGGRGAQSGKR